MSKGCRDRVCLSNNGEFLLVVTCGGLRGLRCGVLGGGVEKEILDRVLLDR